MPTHKEISNLKSQISNWIFKLFLVFTVYFCFLSLIIYHLSPIFSISPLEQAQNDYSYQLTKLSDFHEKFITAKANYLSYQTAVSKNYAFLKTKDYFIQVYYVYSSYLFLIEEKTNVFDWSLSSFKKDDIHAQVEKETEYLNNNLKQAQTIQTLEEIQTRSMSLQEHIKTITLPIIAKTVLTSDIAQVEDSLGSFNLLSQKIDLYTKGKINESDQPLYQNWKSEVESIKYQLDIQIKDSKKLLGQNYIINNSDQNQSPTKIFIQNSQKILDRAKNILYEILNFI